MSDQSEDEITDDGQTEEKAPAGNEAEAVGIPAEYRIRRKYTMSAAAMAQRRAAAALPKPGMIGKRNAWKHGEYSKTMLTRIKPCLSTCDKYPCELVETGATEAGGDCLDAGELLGIIRAVHRVLSNPKESEDFIEISAVNIGNSMRILEMLQEDILRDGTIVRSKKFDKSGNCFQEEIKPHPSLYALPKMVAELGMSPEQFMITPKAMARNTNEEEAIKTIADMMLTAGSKIASKQKPSGETDGAD
jgi:hypothetical protein